MDKTFTLANNLLKNTTIFLNDDGVVVSHLKELINKKKDLQS